MLLRGGPFFQIHLPPLRYELWNCHVGRTVTRGARRKQE
jgi:hypothetical protein